MQEANDVAPRDQSAAELAGRLGIGLSNLLRDEARLAVLEFKAAARHMALGTSMFSVVAIAGFLGICCFATASILALAIVVQPWFAALITAAALLLTAVFVVLPGWKGVLDRRPVTTDVRDSIRADIAALRSGVRR